MQITVLAWGLVPWRPFRELKIARVTKQVTGFSLRVHLQILNVVGLSTIREQTANIWLSGFLFCVTDKHRCQKCGVSPPSGCNSEALRLKNVFLSMQSLLCNDIILFWRYLSYCSLISIMSMKPLWNCMVVHILQLAHENRVGAANTAPSKEANKHLNTSWSNEVGKLIRKHCVNMKSSLSATIYIMWCQSNTLFGFVCVIMEGKYNLGWGSWTSEISSLRSCTSILPSPNRKLFL